MRAAPPAHSTARRRCIAARARPRAGQPAADEAAIGLAATLEQAGKPREALETYRELQLTFREAAAFELADAGARRLSARLQRSPNRSPKPTTTPSSIALPVSRHFAAPSTCRRSG